MVMIIWFCWGFFPFFPLFILRSLFKAFVKWEKSQEVEVMAQRWGGHGVPSSLWWYLPDSF